MLFLAIVQKFVVLPKFVQCITKCRNSFSTNNSFGQTIQKQDKCVSEVTYFVI